MYHINKMLSRHTEENYGKYMVIICLFAAGIAAGLLYARNMPGELNGFLTERITLLAEGVSGDNFKSADILKNTLFKNLKILLIIFLCSISGVFLPIICIRFVSLGFSVGFSVGYLAYTFGNPWVWIALISVSPLLVLSFPSYALLTVMVLNNFIHHNRKGAIYYLSFLSAFLVSMASVFADAYFVPYLIGKILQ